MAVRIMIALACLWLTAGGDAIAQEVAIDPPIAQAYTLDVVFDPLAAMIGGEMTVTWTNRTGEPQATLPFRLYPNADYYGEAGIALSSVMVDGQPVVLDGDSPDSTVVHVPMGDPVQPGGTRRIAIDFTAAIPVDSAGSFGIFRGNSASGTWALVNWYPIVAGWDPVTGWYLDSPPTTVDPTFPTASAWDATITHPANLALVATGEERTVIAGEEATTAVELEVGRELAVMALPIEDVAVEQRLAGRVPVVVTLSQADVTPGMHAALLGIVGEAVQRYGAWLGLPLASEIDLVSANLDGALGVAWTGAIWLDLDRIPEDGQLDDAERESLRFVVLHEVAHQWIANVLGSNSNTHTWLTEGLANVLAVAVVRDIDGPAAAERAFRGGVAGPYRAFVNGGQDAVADSPIGVLDPLEHSFVTYGKAGVGFEAIRQQIGDGAFFDALAVLTQERAWEIVTPEDVLAAFETTSGQELDALWGFWFYGTGATVAGIDAVIAGAGR